MTSDKFLLVSHGRAKSMNLMRIRVFYSWAWAGFTSAGI